MRKYKLSINGQTFNVEIISEQIDSYEVSVNGELIIVNKDSSQILNQTPKPKISQKIEKPKENLNQEKNVTESLPENTNAKIDNNSIKALMPGKVLKVLVETGENVDSGTPLLVIESMKMENVISSNKKGKVQNIFVQVDDNVQYDQPLVEIS
ncbi:MAG: biotin/lipoyl-containing protein [Chloroflexota bacterium]|nr:biotin/lipoyl-containing protein [Chloroflexota bacterium]GIS30780.1 MAG: acetyl-CoA carboxylase biotin carboxyl carrier protein subunit [Dehalococcoidia bacterium]